MNLTFTCDEALLGRAIPGWGGIGPDRAAGSRAILSAVERAFLRDLQPLADPSSGHAAGRYKATLYLPDGLAAQVMALAKKKHLSEAAVLRGLLLAIADAEPSSLDGETLPADHPIVRLNAALRGAGEKAEDRVEQVKIYDCIHDSLTSHSIGLVEAGTGVGKTRAEIAAAIDFIRESDLSLCLAVPTLALIQQAVDEYARQRQVTRQLPPLRTVRGRREFVSRDAVLRALTNDKPVIEAADRAAAERWLQHGCGKDEHFPWSSDSLERAAPGLPIDELRLGEFTDKSDPGYLAYRAQFTRGDDDSPAEIILCTHAMLAQDARMRMRELGRDESFQAIQKEIFSVIRGMAKAKKAGKSRPALGQQMDVLQERRGRKVRALSGGDNGLLPPYSTLIVDEAHLLEETFANALSDYASLKALIRELWAYREAGGRMPVSVIQASTAIIQRISGQGHAGEFVSLGRDEGCGILCAQLKRLHTDLKDAFGKPRASDPTRQRHAAEIARTLAVIGAALKNSRGYVHFSAHMAFPQVYVGPYSVEFMLKMLWQHVTSGCCISATLYTERSDGYSSNYQRALLGIESGMAREYPPLHVAWTRDPVRVFTPDPDHPNWLLPPKVKDKDSVTDDWLDEVAAMLRAIHRTSAGGCLALLTSYAAAEGLAERLVDINECLVVARDKVSARQQHLAYCRLMGNHGIKPLWLGLRAAWTGIDVGGHTEEWISVTGKAQKAGEDNVLTDLVIPRLPYMANQSLTFRWRVKNRPHFPWATLDAAFLFKQGLGRLIRRPGLPANRRIFVLDARMIQDHADAHRALFWNVLLRYPHRTALREGHIKPSDFSSA